MNNDDWFSAGQQPNFGGQQQGNFGGGQQQQQGNFGGGQQQGGWGVSPPQFNSGVRPPGQFGAGGGVSAPFPNQGVSQPQVWNPATAMSASAPSQNYDGEVDDIPILEELNIDPKAIWLRMQGIAFFKRLEHNVVVEADMWGPLLIVIALGISFVLGGKLQFGFIYGLSVGGFVGLYFLINAMSPSATINLGSTVSILGYGLLPVVLLSTICIVVSLRNTIGAVIAVLVVFWCTATTSRFFEEAVSMHEQRWLVAYPISLVYALFVIITVF